VTVKTAGKERSGISMHRNQVRRLAEKSGNVANAHASKRRSPPSNSLLILLNTAVHSKNVYSSIIPMIATRWKFKIESLKRNLAAQIRLTHRDINIMPKNKIATSADPSKSKM
jgi:hypothetical protein